MCGLNVISDNYTASSSGRPESGRMQGAEPDRETAADGEGWRVVFVEDDYLTALSTVDALEEAGYDVVAVARTGEDAVAAVANEKPDLVVMDVRLNGGLDGVDAAVEIFRKFGVRAVFATAHTDEQTRARASAARPLAWLAKPYSDRQLMNVLAAARTKLD